MIAIVNKLMSEDLKFNIVMLGDSTVGKTCLSTCFTEGLFPIAHLPTLGIDQTRKQLKVKGRSVDVLLWDTAGQERLRAVSKNFFTQADAIVLVFDCTNRESWENVERWIQQIDKNACAGVKKILVSNKVDLEEVRDIWEEEGKLEAEKFG